MKRTHEPAFKAKVAIDAIKEEEEITRDDLLKEIGKLRMENEFLKKVQTNFRLGRNMIGPDNKLSINKQCELLNFPKST